MPAWVTTLTVGDDPAAWASAGFAVRDGECALGSVRIRFDGSRPGISAWTLFHPDEPPGPRSLDGLDTEMVDSAPDPSEDATTSSHPNTASGLDHIVVSTPDIERTTTAFRSIGVEPRRTRDTTAGDAPMRQRFFRMGTIIEVVGPPEPAAEAGPARFWGLALVVPDLETAATVIGPALGRRKDAVQPGRQIATLRTGELGISVPVAFMTPHPR